MSSIFTVIVNHNENQKAIQLKQHLSEAFNPVLIDSGSTFEEGEKEHFDITLPNVFYNGLINHAYEQMTPEHTHLFIITSDVIIEDPQALKQRMDTILDDPSVGAYAPSAVHTTHNHMVHKKNAGIRRVTFTDGFCYAIPKEFLAEICPIDLEVNRIGHGTEIYNGYLGMINKRYTVVDHAIVVDHPKGSGYSPKEARIQRDNWFATKSRKAQIYHYWVSMDWLKNRVGFYAMLLLLKIMGRKNP